MGQYKPRYNRSDLKVLKASDLRANYNGKNGGHREPRVAKIARDQGVRWRRIPMATLGFLAAKGKVSIIQVHSLMGDNPDKKFTKAFLGEIDLRQPTDQDMTQIHLFSHLLF